MITVLEERDGFILYCKHHVLNSCDALAHGPLVPSGEFPYVDTALCLKEPA